MPDQGLGETKVIRNRAWEDSLKKYSNTYAPLKGLVFAHHHGIFFNEVIWLTNYYGVLSST